MGLKTLVAGSALAAVAVVGVPHSTGQAAPVETPAKPVAAATEAPTTATVFTEMFDQVSPTVWGGGDVSTSVRIADGRTVWLYGDTLSGKHGMVNSTALVQTGGTLHVSHGGEQLLPRGGVQNGRKTVYWIETAQHAGDNKVSVTVAPMSIGTKSVWDFKRATVKSRTATLSVDEAGDVNFTGWGEWVAEPTVEKTLLGVAQGVPAGSAADKGAVHYRKNAHPQFTLEGGKTLKTICRNRTDGDMSDLKDYRPIFIEE